MPTYNWRHKKTGEEKQIFMSISEGDEYEKAHPLWERMCGMPMLIEPVRVGRKKPSNDFRDKLKTIQKHHPLGKINTWG